MSKKIPSKDLHFKLQDWINKTLGKPNPIFNNLPACPYAKQAWVSDKVEVRQFQSWVDAYTDLLVNDFDFEKSSLASSGQFFGRQAPKSTDSTPEIARQQAVSLCIRRF